MLLRFNLMRLARLSDAFFAQLDGDGEAKAMFLEAKVIFLQPFSLCKSILDATFFAILSFLIARFIVIFSNITGESLAGKPSASPSGIQCAFGTIKYLLKF